MDEILRIFQYQTVLFNSTTTGATPINLNWGFPGGLPLSGTGSSNVILYNVPGEYTVSLTATDSFGTSDVLIKPNIIRVDPTTVNAGISGPSAPITMSQDYAVFDASVANPFPAISWYWQLPQGVTASTQNVDPVIGYSDWNTLTGSYSGSPGSSHFGEIRLSVDNGFSPSTAVSFVEVLKMGRSEAISLNSTGATGFGPYATGTSSKILTDPPNLGVVPQTLSNLGYSGTGSTAYALGIDFNLKTLGTRSNFSFHSTNESAIVQITTGFYTNAYLNSGPGDLISGFLIVNGPIYSSYSSVPVSLGITAGNYLVPLESTDFYIADFDGGSPGLLTEVYDNRNYSVPLINYLLSNPYKLVFSGNIQYVNDIIPGALTFVDLEYFGPPGNGNNNPAVYSPQLLDTIIGTPNNIYEVYIQITPFSGTPALVTAQIGTVLGQGNDPLTGLQFFTAQDIFPNLGFVSFLNAAVSSLTSPFNTSITFESQEFFNCDYSGTPGTWNSPSDYHGAALKIIDRQFVQSVSITDNSETLNAAAVAGGYTGPAIAPFTANVNNLQGATATCTGMFDLSPGTELTIYPGINNILIMGGSIAY